jgi:hypothetical protein
MFISQAFAAESISSSADWCISADTQSATDSEACLAPTDADINGATSGYLNRPLRSRSQVCMENRHRKAA